MANNTTEIDALERYFEAVIGTMDSRFTSHEFFLRLDHQSEYVAALTACADSGYPFRDLHHALAKRLRKLEGRVISLRRENYPSRDIFGTPSHSGLWKKL